MKKGLYLDEENKYQAECIKLLESCGHSQGKFLGILAHDFILRTGVDINHLNKDTMKNYIRLMEVQYDMGFNPHSIQLPSGMNMQSFQNPASAKSNIISDTSKSKLEYEDEIIREEDMNAMEDALSAFNI